MNQTRAFIALDLPPAIQEAIEQQTSRLRKTLGDELVRWVAPHNLHLTLKFLGNVPNSHLDFIKRMLTQTADSHSAFDLQVSGLGSFPNSKRIRVLWVGIHAPAELASLQKSIESGTQRLGYEKEMRAFSPHLTLGRVRQTIDPKQLQTISQTLAMTQLGRIGIARVDSVHLYQSDLNSDGSVYTNLFSTPLR
jgi:RNA 2',3'-cyclic 3'-phosphodiesterase